MLTFMDIETYDQIELATDFVGDERAQFLQDGMKVMVQLHEGRPIGITLPQQVILTVAEADPVTKGQTASSVLQDRRARKRHSHAGAALHRSRRARHRLHGRRLLRQACGVACAYLSPALNVMMRRRAKPAAR